MVPRIKSLRTADWITGIRILCALSLIFCPTFSGWFYALYIVGGVSDVLDGAVARHLAAETPFGAQLDTAADMAFTIVVIIKVVRAMALPVWLLLWTGGIAAIKCVNLISGWILYKRFVSEHTVMNKICGLLLFALPLCAGLLPRAPVVWLTGLSCVAATLAAVQEGHYIRTGKDIR